jgi:hypothetical protein
MLATPGASGSYFGNWSIGTSGTSAGSPVTIDGSGVSDATLDGNHGSNSSPCSTATCDGPVVAATNNMFLAIKGVTIENGDGTAGFGGGLQNDSGGTVTITDSTFSGNTANEGGAIDNAGMPSSSDGSGTVTITGSTFSDNAADTYGGAISNGDGAFGGAGRS